MKAVDGYMHNHQTLKKLKHLLYVGQLMAAVFWTRKGVPMLELIQQGTTATSKVYCRTLKNLYRAIQNKA
jgi:hypothetical protein